MKLLSLVSTFVAAAYAAELEAQGTFAEQPKNLQSLPNGQKVLPRLMSAPVKAGQQRKHVPYGTFSISSQAMTKRNKMAAGPCGATACLVTGMEATIKYGANWNTSKEANVDTGAWLHHIALFGAGGGQGSLWAAGNERPTLRLDTGGKYGLSMGSFMMIIDLMSEDTKAKEVTLFISYDYVPATTPGYKAASMYWLTIGEPQAKSGVYKFSSNSQSMSVPGQLLYAIGHMHDGGTDMRLYVNSKLVCKSVMHYNARAGYGSAAGMGNGPAAAKAGGAKAATGAKAGAPAKAAASHSHARRDGPGGHAHGGNDGMEHISDPGACTDFGDVKKGDRLTAEAWYDANAHPLMVHNGKKEALMGNMRVYVGPK